MLWAKMGNFQGEMETNQNNECQQYQGLYRNTEKQSRERVGTIYQGFAICIANLFLF